ncbi:MAG TPA: hypothetical protein VHM00_00450 [Caldimonas sp.]|jgi:hypothetical protein|nr:hypothetical protein [Caldimonas sp.]HEX2539534.1 hypothetical protein [Caldimonas sp.]
MDRPARLALAALFCAAALAGCATRGMGQTWTTLVDGPRGLDNFVRVNGADWQAVDGAIQATQGGKEARTRPTS